MPEQLKEGDLVYTPDGHPGVVVSGVDDLPFGPEQVRVCWWDEEDTWSMNFSARETVTLFDVDDLKPRELDS